MYPYAIFFLWISLAVADEVGRFYPTEKNGSPLVEGARTYNLAVEEARKAADSRQAEDDPEGNWGDVINGSQLSVRLDKEQYAFGETLVAHIIIRNLGSEVLAYPFSFPDLETQISIIDDRYQSVSRLKPPSERPQVVSGGAMQIRPGWQRKYDFRIDTLYKFSTPGTYSINVSRPVYGPNSTRVMVASRNVLVKIMAEGDSTTNSPNSTPAQRGSKSPHNGEGIVNSHTAPQRQSATAVPPASTGIMANASLPSNTGASSGEAEHFLAKNKIGIMGVIVLVTLLLTILWRAARRKPNA